MRVIDPWTVPTPRGARRLVRRPHPGPLRRRARRPLPRRQRVRVRRRRGAPRQGERGRGAEARVAAAGGPAGSPGRRRWKS